MILVLNLSPSSTIFAILRCPGCAKIVLFGDSLLSFEVALVCRYFIAISGNSRSSVLFCKNCSMLHWVWALPQYGRVNLKSSKRLHIKVWNFKFFGLLHWHSYRTSKFIIWIQNKLKRIKTKINTKFIWHYVWDSKFMKNLTPSLTLDLEKPQHTVFLWRFLKVSKSRKQITLFSILPKNERKSSIFVSN